MLRFYKRRNPRTDAGSVTTPLPSSELVLASSQILAIEMNKRIKKISCNNPMQYAISLL